MSNYKKGRSLSASYASFEEAAKGLGFKTVSHRTKDEKKLAKQQEIFSNHHLCKTCKHPMAFLPMSNIFACQNPECGGIQIEKKDADGNLVFSNVIPAFDLLDAEGAKIANYIF